MAGMYGSALSNLLHRSASIGAAIAVAAVSFAQGQPMSLSELQRFRAQVEQQVKAAMPWSQREGKGVVVNYPSSAPTAQVDRAVARFDQAVDLVSTVLKLDPPTAKVPVYLFPSAEALKTALHIPFPVQSGITTGYWVAIPGDDTDDQLARFAVHNVESVLVHDQIGLYGAQLFTDGLGVYMEALVSKAPWVSAPRPLQQTHLRDECDGMRRPEDIQEGAAFIAFLLRRDNGSPAHLKQVLKALSDERLKELRASAVGIWPDKVEQVFKNVYGLDLDQLELIWRSSAKQ